MERRHRGIAAFVAAIVLAAALTACGSTPAATATPSPRPTRTPTAAVPSPTATQQPTATASPSATSTRVPPSPTAPPTAAPPTATFEPWPPPFPAQARRATPSAPDIAALKVTTATLTSPDGQWRADALAALPNGGDYYTRLVVVRTDGTLTWLVVDRWDRLALGYTTPQPFAWSRDGQSLYLTNYPHPDGCSPFVNALDLYKMNVATGGITRLAPQLGLWLSLSPDEQAVAYAGFTGRGLVVRELATGKEREAGRLQPRTDHFVGDQIGHIRWSPDGSSLVYTLAVRPCKDAHPSASVWAESTSIMLVDVATLQQRALLSADARNFITLDWPTPATITLCDRDGRQWTMDVTSANLTPAQ